MARLGEIFTISSGGTPNKNESSYYDGGNIPWVKTGDLKDKYVAEEIECITEEGLNNSSAKLFPKDTVLVAMYGATIGACSILPYEASTNQACAAFLPCHEVIPEYLFYFLSGKKDQFVKDGVGGAQPNISAGYLKNVKIDLISLNDQQKIIDRLNKVDKLISFRKQQLSKLDELVKSRFIEMFGDPQSNPYGYSYRKLSDIATYFNGLTYKPENVVETGTIVLRSSNIQNSQLDFADTIRVDCVIKDRFMVQENDILMCSRNGSAKLVGKVALIKGTLEPMSFGAFMMIIRSQYFGYLMTYFQMDAFRQQIKTGATTTINQITGKMLDDVAIPLPPMALVEQFATFVEQIDKSKLAIQKSLEKLETLKKSLMQKYFG